MRLLTSMLYCLLALFGCDGNSSTTTVTRTQVDGQDTLFSRTTQDHDAATFQCVRSISGRCHYQVFQERCAAQATAADEAKCARTPMDSFSLAVGDRHLLKGLAGQVRECVQAEAPGAGTRCGG
ncbi:hypothetical protein [Pseudoxanthomonas sp.]|uniref:hypothetical protein n=1 Tax=Pseudoxanthomonas sp. TaxID=1871049 RepID=UPI002616BBA2|nr:hypothetical protein [Pseudoxanthomonas sp.]WDS36076.1 MAG: hypothetical protein O8I58_17595 [Pseudoxanthomonas sp.]